MSAAKEDFSWCDPPPHTDDDAPHKPSGPEEPETAKASPTYPLTWYAEIEGPEHAEQVVEDLLIEGCFFVVYGESNSGKTFFLMDLALAVCQGIAWRGKATRKGLVIYVAGEGAASVKNRVAAYKKTRPYVSSASPFAIVSLAVDFMNNECIVRLVDTVKQAITQAGEQPALVLIDTLARAMPGGEENSTEDMGIVVSAADYLRAETGAAVGFVHHSGKDPAKGARGSSALRAATDTEILVEGIKGARTVSVTKQRDLDVGEKMGFELSVVELGANKRGKMVTSCVVNHMDGEVIPEFKPEMRGRGQKQMIAALRNRCKDDPTRIWTLHELRTLARDIGLSKSTAKYTVDAIAASQYMVGSIGGYRFTDGDR